jgi:hypothetical protein
MTTTGAFGHIGIAARGRTACAMILAQCAMLLAAPVEAQTPLPNSAPKLAVDATPDVIREGAQNVRAGRKLTPRTWKNGARVAVCFSFDTDNEYHAPGTTLPVLLSTGEYGATTGLPRLLDILDRAHIPGTFFMPAASVILHPEMVPLILRSGRNEIGVHGWTHEYIPALTGPAEERDLLRESIANLEKATGRKPIGYRAPSWEFGPETL